jgi:hypothetical protein
MPNPAMLNPAMPNRAIPHTLIGVAGFAKGSMRQTDGLTGELSEELSPIMKREDLRGNWTGFDTKLIE